MYEQYYGFVQSPFSLTPDPRFLYRSESHDEAIKQVSTAIKRKEGFIVLTGDIGTGKTTICRAIIEQFPASTFTALILNPFLSVEELLREVLLDFGVVSREGARTGRFATASKHELVHTLFDFLLSLVPLRGSAVIIIDEAQHLSHQVLEEIRILSNLETNEHKLLQIVLVGQLNLLDALASADLRQLDQRVSIRHRLKPLTHDEVEAYVAHRLWVARGSTVVTFEPKALELVHRLSGGVPRPINLLCDRALILGAEAQTSRIPSVFIEQAAEQLGLHPEPDLSASRSGRRWWRAAALVVIAVAAALWFFVPQGGTPTAAAPPLPARPARLVSPGLPEPPVPSGDLSTPPPAAPRAPAATPAGRFALLVGVFRPFAAATVVENLSRVGFPVIVQNVDLDEGIGRRVLVGRYATETDAREALRQLQQWPGFAATTVLDMVPGQPPVTDGLP